MNVHAPGVARLHSKRAVLDFVLSNDFYLFVQRVFRTLRPATEFVPNWHMEVICREVMDFLEDDQLHLAANVPPRSGKSIAISVALPAYLLGKNPSMEILCASYALTLSEKLGRDTRTVMTSDWYRRMFPKTIISRNPEEGIFTTAGGCRRASSVGGTSTGLGGDLVVLDDIIKPDEAASDVVRTKAIEWLKSTITTRANDKRKPKTIVVMQRLHVEDPTSFYLNQKFTTHVNLPAIADRDEVFYLGRGRKHHWKVGEPLQAVREDLAVLQRERERLGERIFSAQYLQQPVPLDGGIIKWSWFQTYDERPVFRFGDRHIFSWDTAMTDSASADYSACTEWIVRENRYYLLNIIRLRLLYPDLKQRILLQRRNHPHCLVVIEDKGSGISVAQDLIRDGIGVMKFKPEGDKLMRASLASDAIQQGNVFLPKDANWLRDFELECSAFPYGKHDDQVDSMSQAILWHQHRQRFNGVSMFSSY